MREYESLILMAPKLDESLYEDLIGKISEIVKQYGGEVLKVDRWGLRKLAYPVNKQSEGYYVLMEFKGNNKVLEEFDHFCRINQYIYRALTIRLDERKRKKKEE